MAVSIDISRAVAPIPTVCTQLRVTLPGGLAVQGSVPQIGASPLEAARATISALNSAMAPLGPVFSILDAVLSIVKFAKTVPGVVMRPDKVVSSLVDVVKKASALAQLVPQLSVPLMVLGTIDVLLALLAGISDELTSIAALDGKALELAALAEEIEAMGPIAEGVAAQVQARRAVVSCALGDAKPLITLINIFCEIVGLPGFDFSVDAQSGSLDDVAETLSGAVKALQALRNTIPV